MDETTSLNITAAQFVHARKHGQALNSYPGIRPTTMAYAYQVQDQAIHLWGTPPVGWKVGRITGEIANQLNCDRLAGPIFSEFLWSQKEAPASVNVFKGGFAAVEGEIVAILGRDAPEDKINWTREEALNLVESFRAGVEIASSPYANINKDGPLVTISDFGNNNGLIIGDEIPDWRELKIDEWHCITDIDGHRIGTNTPAAIPGGPLESLRFLLENTARRGMPLKKGAAICTGAVTGVHEIEIGQNARVQFTGTAPIDVKITGPKTC